MAQVRHIDSPFVTSFSGLHKSIEINLTRLALDLQETVQAHPANVSREPKYN